MSSSRSAEGAYESYIFRLYRRDGLRIVGMVEVVESG